ncbi:MAG: polyhydroxybutyrate depolymerase, partial [Frankiales bacterium]|nr:polyhydroxybutyrate depolymerase [Frankiales bacterium]
MRRTALLALLLLAVVAPARAGFAPEASTPTPLALPPVGLPGTTETVTVGERSFVLHVPDGLLGPAPLLVVLHAFSKDAETMRRVTGFEALADREGFVVVFGSGRDSSWNAGRCCGPARTLAVDDVAYLDDVVLETARRVRLDERRIGVSGFSNGAMMALRYACERADVVASVAVVAGTLVSPCAPSAPVDVLDLHGTADRTVPLDGGRNERLSADFPAVRGALVPFTRAGGEAQVRPQPGEGHHWVTGASTAVWD